MKPAFLNNLGAKAAKHKVVTGIVAVIAIIAIAAGGWFGWQEYERRQTAAFAAENIKKALQSPDPHALAHLVNFNALSRELSRAIIKSFPFFMSGPDQEHNVNQILQTALLEKFTEKEQKASMFPEDANERAQLEKPLTILPADFAAQLARNLQTRQTGSDTALAITSITHPQLKQTFNLNMDMRKTSDGWQIRRLLNANELAGQLRQAILARFTALREVVQKKNADTAKQMNEMLPIESCTADVGALSGGRMVLMVIHARAKNRSNIQINNFNLDANITDSHGQSLARRFLNAAQPVPPGQDFDHRWTMELESSDPLAKTLLAHAPLKCRASWQTLSLGKPKVLHIEEVPNKDIPCTLPNHNHPAGFCELPVFKR